MKVAIVLNLISILPGAILYFVGALGMALAATPSAELGAWVTLGVGWGSGLVALAGGILAIVMSNPKIKWRAALVSTVGAIICFPVLGLVALVFLVRERKRLMP